MNSMELSMFTAKSARKFLLNGSFGALLAAVAITCAQSAEMNIRDVPLFLNDTPPPLNMLVLSRDHRLHYEAYNDASDLDGDGTLDVGYKPGSIDYYGYFETDRCYTYASGIYSPSSSTSTKKCAGAEEWSGDWLNYMTTSRMDALRKVLYGGLRYIDTDTDTVLQRAYVPSDAHSWGKEYSDATTDGYDIRDYTPLDLPAAGRRHLFANTTLTSDGNETMAANSAVNGWKPPRFRYLLNRQNRIWDWVSKEVPVAAGSIDNSRVGGGSADGLTSGSGNTDAVNFTVRVRVCRDGDYGVKSNCKVYGSTHAKPTGLLQDYGESNSMYFGLLTGSYGKPHDGGVLRRGMGSIRDEIDATTGQFKYNLAKPGVINTIDRMRVTDFNEGSLSYGCGWITNSSDAGANCSMWGNPTAEMMVETLRYFAGETAPTYDFSSGANNSQETSIGLSTAAWDSTTNPYRAVADGGFPACSKPFETVISDISPSYDSDKVPGAFGASTQTYNGKTLSAGTLGDKIWSKEGLSGSYFIGESNGVYDGAPTVKTVTSFGNIRGLAPEQPTKEGSYLSGSVAYFGHQNDISAAKGSQKVQTFAVALASPLPNIRIKVGGKEVTLVPYAKSVGGAGISANTGTYQPTNQIVDFYVDTITPTYGKFRVNFEDVEQGADHDMDAVSIYEYKVNADSTVTVTLTSEYAAGGIIQHMGYVISGTTKDGTYLEVRDVDTAPGTDPDYFLDTPAGQSPGGTWNDGQPLPAGTANPASRTFTVGGDT